MIDKMLPKRILLAAFGVLVTFSFIGINQAHAQVETSPVQTITISPAVTRPSVASGEVRNEKVTVINNGTTDYTFLMYARPFSVSDELYAPNFTSTSERTNAYKWIYFPQDTYSLKAGERVDVPYTVIVPQGIAPGGHYAVIFAETQPPENVEPTTGVTRKERVGTLLYITADGTLEKQGSLQSWDVSTWQKKPPITSGVRIENTGNVHFQATVKIQYIDLLGKEKFSLDHQVLILPDTTRKISAEWTGAPMLGIFKARGTVEFLDTTETLPQKYIVIISPLLIAAVGAGLLVLIGYIVFRKRRKGTKQSRGASKK